MSGLADYLAKNYLTADSEKKSKKRKRKNKDSGLVIEDDDNLGWKEKADEDDEDAPMIGKMNLIRSICDSSANMSFPSRWRHPQENQEEIERHRRRDLDHRRCRRTFKRRTARRRCSSR